MISRNPVTRLTRDITSVRKRSAGHAHVITASIIFSIREVAARPASMRVTKSVK